MYCSGVVSVRPRAARKGFLLLEALIALGLFAIFVTAVGLSLLTAARSATVAADRTRGMVLAQAAMEATRSIRDRAFSNLTAGAHGVVLQKGVSGWQWEFSGTSATETGGYVTDVTVSAVSTGKVRVAARAAWSKGQGRSGSVLLTEDMTDWAAGKLVGNWSSPTLKGTVTPGGTPLFNDVAVYGNYAFVSSETSSGGAGLYVFDVTNPLSPVRVSSSFGLGAAGYELAVRGSLLYVLTSDPAQEIRVYSLAHPTAFSSADLLASYNLPGTARAKSLALIGTTLAVGAAQDATEKELYAFDVSVSTGVTLLGSVDDSAAVEGIVPRGSRLYIASATDAAELRVADLTDPEAPLLATGSGYNLTDVQDGLSVAYSGTAAVLGRALGAAIDELVLFDVQSSYVPSTPPGPWTLDTAGAVNAIEFEPGGRYAFVASDGTAKQLRVMDVYRWENGGGSAEKGFYTVAVGNGRGLAYDAWQDRVYLVTNTQFLVLAPS